jgi:hypothetical protein
VDKYRVWGIEEIAKPEVFRMRPLSEYGTFTAMLAYFGTLFHPDNLAHLTKEEFKSFLLIKNNKHWEEIQRTFYGREKSARNYLLGLELDRAR